MRWSFLSVGSGEVFWLVIMKGVFPMRKFDREAERQRKLVVGGGKGKEKALGRLWGGFGGGCDLQLSYPHKRVVGQLLQRDT